jgi:DNA mismatch repair protein MutS2
MPEAVVEHARTTLTGREDGSDEIIRRIEESHRAAMDDQREARQAAMEADALRKRYEEQLRKLENAREKVEDEVRIKGKQLLDRYTKRLDRAMNELQKTTVIGKRSERIKGEAKEALRKVQEDIVEIAEPVEDVPVEGVEFKKGDTVRLANLNQIGTLLTDIKDGEATVMIGAMRVNVPATSLRPAGAVKKEERGPERISGASVNLTKATNVSIELNLIAQRAEEALYNLETYLDEAQAAGLKEVRIIHGKGTGALKAAVWAFIKDYPAVDSYRIADHEEGGAGATVVSLKV